MQANEQPEIYSSINKKALIKAGNSDRAATRQQSNYGYEGIITLPLPHVKRGIEKLIEKVLNKTAAIELFEREAILFGQSDAVPFYRAVELFGEEAAIFFDKNIKFGGYLEGGRDYNTWGACSDERPSTNYLYKAGFLKLVTEHNYLLVVKAHKESEGGHILDRYGEERRKRVEKKANCAGAKAIRETSKSKG